MQQPVLTDFGGAVAAVQSLETLWPSCDSQAPMCHTPGVTKQGKHFHIYLQRVLSMLLRAHQPGTQHLRHQPDNSPSSDDQASPHMHAYHPSTAPCSSVSRSARQVSTLGREPKGRSRHPAIAPYAIARMVGMAATPTTCSAAIPASTAITSDDHQLRTAGAFQNVGKVGETPCHCSLWTGKVGRCGCNTYGLKQDS